MHIVDVKRERASPQLCQGVQDSKLSNLCQLAVADIQIHPYDFLLFMQLHVGRDGIHPPVTRVIGGRFYVKPLYERVDKTVRYRLDVFLCQPSANVENLGTEYVGFFFQHISNYLPRRMSRVVCHAGKHAELERPVEFPRERRIYPGSLDGFIVKGFCHIFNFAPGKISPDSVNIGNPHVRCKAHLTYFFLKNQGFGALLVKIYRYPEHVRHLG